MAYEIERKNIADKGLKCFVCNKRKAQIRSTIVDDIVVMNVCVCSQCAGMGPFGIMWALNVKPVVIPPHLLAHAGAHASRPG